MAKVSAYAFIDFFLLSLRLLIRLLSPQCGRLMAAAGILLVHYGHSPKRFMADVTQRCPMCYIALGLALATMGVYGPCSILTMPLPRVPFPDRRKYCLKTGSATLTVG